MGEGAVTRAVWKRQHLLSFDSLWFGQVNGWLLGFPVAVPVVWNIETNPAEDSWPSEKVGGTCKLKAPLKTGELHRSLPTDLRRSRQRILPAQR